MSHNGPTQSKAGWFVDPVAEDNAQQCFRFWDGIRWTERVSDGSASKVSALDEATSGRLAAAGAPSGSSSLMSVLAAEGNAEHAAWVAESKRMSWPKRVLAIVTGGGLGAAILLSDFLPTIWLLLIPNALLLLIGVINPAWHRIAAHWIAWPLLLITPIVFFGYVLSTAWSDDPYPVETMSVVPTALVALFLAFHGRRK